MRRNEEPILSPVAKRQVKEIWVYSFDMWGEAQAYSYVEGLKSFISTFSLRSRKWRVYKNKRLLKQLSYQKYKKHLVFCSVNNEGTIEVVSILHQNMDIPKRLLDDAL